MKFKTVLLDFSNEDVSYFQGQGFDVEVGKIGICDGEQLFPAQLYERDVYVYCPSVIKNLTKLHLVEKLTPEFSLDELFPHIRKGGILVVFVNHLSDNLVRQFGVYSWLDDFFTFSKTNDRLIRTANYEASNLLSSLLLKSTEIKIPVCYTINSRVGGATLFSNKKGDSVGVLMQHGSGCIIVLPEFNDNRAISTVFLNSVFPKLLKVEQEVEEGLLSEYKTVKQIKTEDAIDEIDDKICELQSKLAEQQTELENTKQSKSNIINSDNVALRIIKLYEEAFKEKNTLSLFDLYKILEILRLHFGSEPEFKKELGCAIDLNFLKRTMNDGKNDVRHTTGPDQTPDGIDQTLVDECFAKTKKIIFAYLDSLF